MALRIITPETLRAERRARDSEERVAYVGHDGRVKHVTKRIVAGEMVTFDLEQPLKHYLGARGEMLTTPGNLDTLVQKTVLDLELGREAVPLLYQPIYRRTEDPNFTQNVEIKGATSGQVVFVSRLELEEVQFGARITTAPSTVPILTYAAGMQITEDMREYDQTWELSETSRAMGEAYNALLNHIHIYPIISFTYAAKNQTAANADATLNAREKLRATLRAGLVHSAADVNTTTRRPRAPRILLAHSSRRWDLEEALGRFTVNGTEYPPLPGIDTMIFYDGRSLTVGEKVYSYGGVATTKVYLIEPQVYFRELVKHDLRVDAGNADLSRLIEEQIVGRARRGTYAAPADAVEEVTIPA